MPLEILIFSVFAIRPGLMYQLRCMVEEMEVYQLLLSYSSKRGNFFWYNCSVEAFKRR